VRINMPKRCPCVCHARRALLTHARLLLDKRELAGGCWGIHDTLHCIPLNADKQVFPRLDVMGWYATGEDLEPKHMDVNKMVSLVLQS
jgi:hypothetical protein